MEFFKGSILQQTIVVDPGSIVDRKCDAYVIPHWRKRLSQSGVSEAVKAAGAEFGIAAMTTHIESQGDEIKFGDAFLAKSGGGNSKYLIHVSLLGVDKTDLFSTVQKATYNALVEAKKQSLKSIAFPVLGDGFGGYLPAFESAQAMMSAVYEFAKRGRKFDKISFVPYRSEAASYDITAVLKNKSYTLPKSENEKKRNDEFIKWIEGREMGGITGGQLGAGR